MAGPIDELFIQQINQNAGIAHKVALVYFQDEDRQDVLQEMMYQLWRSYSNFDGRSKFSTWMYRVCLNTAFTYRRQMKNDKVDRLSSAHHQIAEEPSTTNESLIGQLSDAIATLSPVNKAIILLYLEDLSYEEIAGITGLTKSNVSVRLVRIKRCLETEMKKIISKE